MSDLLLGIDIGSQSVKGAIVDRAGQLVAAHSLEHDLSQQWWWNPVAVVRALLGEIKLGGQRISHVGVSGLYPALGPADGDGEPVHGAILYSDNRALEQVERVNSRFGLRLTSEELTPKLIWFLEQRPELARQAEMYFDAAHYFIFKLTGSYVTDSLTAAYYGALFDPDRFGWRGQTSEQLGIPMEILPQVLPPLGTAGTVTREAARVTGLTAGTPVTAGLPDIIASCVSVGAVEAGEAIVYYGTAGLLSILKKDLLPELSAEGTAYDAIDPSTRNVRSTPDPAREGRDADPLFAGPVYCLATGLAVRWFRDQFSPRASGSAGGKEAGEFAQLDERAAAAPPGSGGLLFLPHLQGARSPAFNPDACGVYFGLAEHHDHGHLFRAILESFGYEIRRGLQEHDLANWRPTRLVAAGGGAVSSLWRQIVSDISGLEQAYVPDVGAAFGAAYVAGLAGGWFENFSSLRQSCLERQVITRPTASNAASYEHFFPLYQELNTVLEGSFRLRARILDAS